MPQTYQAILRGDRVVQWRGGHGPPDAAEELEVQITVISDSSSNPNNGHRRQQMIGALEQLARRGTLAELADARGWQRQQRRDRPLDGREQDRSDTE